MSHVSELACMRALSHTFSSTFVSHAHANTRTRILYTHTHAHVGTPHACTSTHKNPSLQVMRDKVTGLSKGFGFVSYDSPQAAQMAIQSMNGMQVAYTFTDYEPLTPHP